MSEESRLGAMDPYGLRAMRYVRDHCPSRYATIEDPIDFFSNLGLQLRDEVLALVPAPGQPPPPPKDWADAVGQTNMAMLMAEDQVFSEFFQAMPPEDDPGQTTSAWEPLMPDLSDIAQAEADQDQDQDRQP